MVVGDWLMMCRKCSSTNKCKGLQRFISVLLKLKYGINAYVGYFSFEESILGSMLHGLNQQEQCRVPYPLYKSTVTWHQPHTKYAVEKNTQQDKVAERWIWTLRDKPCGTFECFPRAVAPKLSALSPVTPLIQIVQDMSFWLMELGGCMAGSFYTDCETATINPPSHQSSVEKQTYCHIFAITIRFFVMLKPSIIIIFMCKLMNSCADFV